MDKLEPSLSRRDFLKMAGVLPASLCVKPRKEDKSDEGLLEERQFNLFGSTIDFLGVSHTRTTFENNENLFKDRIGKSDLVISEILFFEPSTKKLRSITEAGIGDPSALYFYENIEKLTASERKPIGAVDPESFYLNLWNNLIMPLLPWAQITDIVMGKDIKQAILDELREKYHFNTKVDIKPMSRRDFLKKMGLLALTTILNYNYFLVSDIRTAVSGEDWTKAWSYGFDDKFLPDVFNYRNIRSGQGLRKLCQCFEKQGGRKITVISGLAHMNLIMEYAQNEHKAEVALKSLPNAFYDVLGNESVRIYDYDKQKNDWIKRTAIS